MTSVFQARRRAEEFAAAVDGAATSSARREQELTTLLEVVASLREQESVAPRAEFARDLRSRLMLEAESALAPQTPSLVLPVRQRGRRERRLVAAASAFVLIGGTTTMAAAAQSALPGEALYPIKRGIERAEAELSMSPAGKGEDLLRQASSRLAEVRSLVGDTGNVQVEPRVQQTLESFGATADEGSAVLFEAYHESGDPQTVVTVRTFAAEGIAELEQLAPIVPSEAQDELAAAAMLLHDIDREAASLCSGCAADLPLVEVPGIFLAHAEVERALALASHRDLDNNHPVVVRRDAAPDAAEPSTAPDSDPVGATDPTAGPTAPAPLPSPSVEPGTWPSLLPGLDGTKTGSGSTSDGSAETLSKDIQDGLSGVVETLLPDPDGILD